MRSHFFLLRELVRRDFQSRYAGSALGLAWSLVQPLWTLLLLTFVFSTVMKISPVGSRTGHFAIFLFCGLLPWMALQEGVLRASTSITDNSSLVKKLRFPSEILVLSVVLSALLHEAIAGVIFLGVLAALGELRWGGLPLLLLAVPLQIALTVGLGLLLGTLHVFFRDVAQVLGMILMGWFYLTPIVYPASLVPERFQAWIELNPLTALVGLYRQALLEGEVSWVPGTVSLTLTAAVLLSVGLWIFASLKPAFVDEI
ncbi:MAG TPA: ABC transporter permease [Thermoanaerobaculia bacterium]|nr:ABC transporter permease [Thermoanaerobaculia bacterium]